MDLRQKKTIGILMVLIFIFGILSIVPVLEQPEYLLHVKESGNQIYQGSISQMIMVGIYIGLVICINPMIKSYSRDLSLYFTVARSISIGFHLMCIILLMLFIPLSEMYNANPHSSLEAFGEVLRQGRDLLNHIGVIIPYLMGSLIFYYVLLKQNVIKEWLIVLGFVGIALSMLSSLLILFNVITLISPLFILCSLPLALQELILAFIFIFKKKS